MQELSGLVIVGGGAAGLAAAIFAAEAGAGGVVVLEGAAAIGAKILVSGGGRCNVTHRAVSPEDFNCSSRHIVRNILAAFDVAKTIEWFAAMGVELKEEETGKLFPVTDSAHTVVDALLRRCDRLGVVIRTNSRVTQIVASPQGRGFTIEMGQSTLRCARVVMATGGRSLPKSGSDGFGWEVARKLGHTVTPTYAALVPLVLAEDMFHAELAGISQEVDLWTFVEGRRADHRRGSLLWTHFGVSGPVLMDASRHWVIASESGRKAEMRCNLLPGEAFDAAEKWLIETARSHPRMLVVNVVAGRLPDRVAAAVVAHAGVAAATTSGQLPREDRRRLVHALTALPLPVVRQRGWNYAEVTAGGVPLAEVDYRTMESRKVPGLYLVGEILDCDGRIGGFNFQWAWATGYVCGRAAGSASARP